ncbi:MAG: lipoate--protein ligase [Clostridiaceae bacterium]|nr:lipoate--protein ligase [Clostridiaceae bacterium]
MADNSRIIFTKSIDPWWNLAGEEYLLDRVEPGQCILYLWQNNDTVVIGRNQNPWRECRAQELEADGGKLARRLSGGGAVFHDIGNINFTFVVSKELYNLDKQLDVILNAVRSFGIGAQRSGRNDIIADGRKFSGNAFCFRKRSAYHHGTILVSSDFDKLSKYLQVSEEKMRYKGVQSVQSRVVNLSELSQDITVERMADALIDSFRASYGSAAPVEKCVTVDKEGKEALEELYCKYLSWTWRYGEAPKFDVTIEKRFDWGSVELGIKLEGGIVSSLAAYSDALDEEYIALLPELFRGCHFDSKKLAQRLRQSVCEQVAAIEPEAADEPLGSDLRRTMALDLAQWVESKKF